MTMDLNTLMSLLALLFLAGLLFQRWRIMSHASRLVGVAAPDAEEVDGGVTGPNRVYYFYSEGCRVCRDIRPMVDGMAAEYPNLIRVDVSEHLELAAQFDVMGTPTFIAVEEGLIRDVKIGSASRVWLTACLAPRTG